MIWGKFVNSVSKRTSIRPRAKNKRRNKNDRHNIPTTTPAEKHWLKEEDKEEEKVGETQPSEERIRRTKNVLLKLLAKIRGKESWGTKEKRDWLVEDKK